MSHYCQHNNVIGRCPHHAQPGGMLVLPANVTYRDFAVLKRLWYANAAEPQMVIRPTYESYRRALYGDGAPDSFMALNYGLLAGVIVLILAVVYLILTP